MVHHAGRLCWWAACREVVAEMRRRFRENFIADPKFPPVTDKESANRYVCESKWYKRLASTTAQTTAGNVRQLLEEAHKKAEAWLGDGQWRFEFAGKEILRDTCSRFFDRQRFPAYRSRDAEFMSDIAKEVASWQVKNDRVPTDLSDLRDALKLRIGAAASGP